MFRKRIEVQGIYPNMKYKHLLKSGEHSRIDAIGEILFFKIETPNQINFCRDVKEIFYDSIIQEIHFEEYDFPPNFNYVVEIGFRPGVTDNLGHTTTEALGFLGINANVSTGKIYLLETSHTKVEVDKFARESLGNDLIETINIYETPEFKKINRFSIIDFPEVKLEQVFEIKSINLNVSNEQLIKLNHDRCLALSLKELNCIRDYYNSYEVKTLRAHAGLPVNPTDLELEVFAQTWSEHCKHKIFSSEIEYYNSENDNLASNFILIDSLYKTYIKKLTKDIVRDFDIKWLVSVFDDNAGIVRFDENIDLCIKVETHNSPSALDPYGGAITGILGVNRDILGSGLGAKPIANTDVFCFCDPSEIENEIFSELPIGLKHPLKILQGVHKGIEDGGNKSGIPTVNGAIYFDQSFAGKPLVFCGTVGVLPSKLSDHSPTSFKKARGSDRVVMIGGFIGADGIHGATMSSLELDENSPATAVQIGDPLTQKRMLDFILIAREKKLFNSLTDNGAGGLSSSVGEMALQSGGAAIDLARCPVKYPGLSPYELFISESQERMTLAVPSDKLKEISDLANLYGVTLTDIGEFTESGYLEIYYNDELVGKINLDFLHRGLPQLLLKARWEGMKTNSCWFSPYPKKEVDPILKNHISYSLKKLLRKSNIASKQSLVKNYDHEVQAATHIKPYMGKTQNGPSDCGVLWLYPHGGALDNGIAISCGLNPRLSQYDPYLMAQFAVDEALRNVVASGGDPEMTCLLDNFCWPDPVESFKNPDGEHKLGQLVRTCMGLYDICYQYRTPLVSGKDSMKNDFRGRKPDGSEVCISILPTLLITAMSKVNIHSTCTSGYKTVGDAIYLLGASVSGLLGSEYLEEFDYSNRKFLNVPNINLEHNYQLYRMLHIAINKGFISSCHDISDGGMLIAVVESMFENFLGAKINLNNIDLDNLIDYLYCEGPGRFIVSIPNEKKNEFEQLFKDLTVTELGSVTNESKFKIYNDNELLIDEDMHVLASLWKKEF